MAMQNYNWIGSLAKLDCNPPSGGNVKATVDVELSWYTSFNSKPPKPFEQNFNSPYISYPSKLSAPPHLPPS